MKASCNGAVAVALAIASVAAVGCATGGSVTPTRGLPLADDPGALIQMRDNGCGAVGCPVYGVSIYTDGTFKYEGGANVAVIGTRRGKLSAISLNSLITAIDAMDFLDSPEACCTCPDGDGANVVVIDYRPGEAQKTIVHQQACRAAPRAMRALEQSIEDVTQVDRWIVARAPSTPGGGDGGHGLIANTGAGSPRP